MKIGMVNKLTIINRYVLHTSQRNIMHLAVIKRRNKHKNRYFERWGGKWKRAKL